MSRFRLPARARRERGYSSIELVLYMPLLMIAILLTVQFALVYLANQYASAAAREANRVARVTGSIDDAEAKGNSVVTDLGGGLLDPASVAVTQPVDGTMRTVVVGKAPQILPAFVPGFDFVEVSETVEGPIEQFVPDGGP